MAYKVVENQSLIITGCPVNIPHCPDKKAGAFRFILKNCDHLSINDMDLMSVLRRNEACSNEIEPKYQPIYALIRFNLKAQQNQPINIINIIRCREDHVKQFYMGQLHFAMNDYAIKKVLPKIPIRNVVTKLLFDNLDRFDSKRMYLDVRNNCKTNNHNCLIMNGLNVANDSQAMQMAIAKSYVNYNCFKYVCICFVFN